MSEVDDRIVSIQFDNASFERRMEQTLRSLDKLSESLRFANAERGFNTITNAANGFNADHMAGAIDHIASKFTALGVIGVTTIARLTTSVLDFARKAGQDILDPILGGGRSRAINLEQAKFLFEGIGIDVEKGMDSALKAVKGTAFGLDEAAKIAAQFGAGGIKAGEQMTSALRGVAGVAALTGKSFSEIGDIFASSAAIGIVNNQDLQQFATRGLNATAALAEQLGKTQEQVREMASNGELDFKTFADAMDKAFGEHATEANKTYTGSLANMRAAFSRLGATFFTPHLEQQRDLFNALTPVIDKVSKVLQPLITDFLVLKRINVDNVRDFLDNIDFHDFITGVRNIAIGLANLYRAFRPVVDVFKSAFNSVFTGSVSKTFLGLSRSFRSFTAGIKIGGDTLAKLRGIFQGFFSVVEIGFTIFKEVIKTIGTLVKALLPAGDGLLSFGKSSGDFLTNLNKALVAGGGIQKFFEGLRDIIRDPISAFHELTDAISDFFHGIDLASSGPLKILQDLRDKIFSFFNIKVSDAAEKGLGRIGQRLEQVHNIWDTVQAAFSKVHNFLQPVLDYMTDWLKSLGDKLADAFHAGDFNAVLDLINVGLLGGIVVLLRRFLKGGLKLDIGSGLIDKISGAFDQLTDTLKAMQTNLKADALKKIAISIGILVASLVVLSLIDSVALTKALVALSVSFGELIGAMTLLDKLNFASSIVKLNGIAAAMILIAGAAVILSIAIAILSRMDLGDLAKGLAGVGVGLGILVLATKGLAKAGPNLIVAGIALGIISAALLVLSGVVKIFATMSLEELAKGLGSVAVSLFIFVRTLNSITANTAGLISAGISIGIIAASLLILSRAVKAFSSMPAGEIAKGMISIAVALGILVLALRLITVDTAGLIAASLAMVGIGIALNIMVKAVEGFAGMPLGELVKGIAAVAAVLLILVVAVNAMSGAAAGAASLIIVAVAMNILARVIETLAQLSVGQIVASLLAMAGALTVIGVAAAIFAATGVLGAIFGLGVALGILGGAFALFGVGAALIAKAFQIMAESGVAGAKAIVEAMKIIVTALPAIEKAIFDFAIGFAKDILKAAPLLVRLFQALMEQLLETVVDLAPKIAEAIGVVIENIAKLIQEKSPTLIQAGFNLLQNFLEGILNNVPQIVNTVADIMVAFLHAFQSREGDVVAAAAGVIVTFIDELSNHISEIVAAVGRLISQFVTSVAGQYSRIIKLGFTLLKKLISGIINNITAVANMVGRLITRFIKAIGENAQRIIDAGFGLLKTFLSGIVDNIVAVANAVGRIITRFIKAVGENANRIINAGVNTIIEFIKGLGRNAVKLANAAADVLVDFLNGMAEAIRTHNQELRDAGFNIISAVIDGMTLGLSSKAKGVVDGVVGLAKEGLGKAKGWLKVVGDPYSLKFMSLAESMANGMRMGLDADTSVEKSSVALVQRSTGAFTKSLNRISERLGTIEDFKPTISPVLDLTEVERSAGGISKLIEDASIAPEVSFDVASHISKVTQPVEAVDTTSEIPPGDIIFNQFNTSPKALQTNDIYRNTKSQFALAKEELGV